MKIVISPAKSLDEKPIDFPGATTPVLLDQSQKLVGLLKKKSVEELGALMGIKEKLAQLNQSRFRDWNADFTPENAKPAIFCFKGTVYEGIDVRQYNQGDLKKLQENLLILSGLYGFLRPFDLMKPYRLEMGVKLKTEGFKDLYDFWGDKIAAEIKKHWGESETIVNLASREYFSSIEKHLKNPIITPIFQDQVKGKFKVVSFWAKKARGRMVSYIIKNKVKKLEQMKGFREEGYYFYAHDEGDVVVFRRNH